MGKKAYSNSSLKLLSGIIAFSLFIYVVYAENPQVVYWIRNVPVSFVRYEHFMANDLIIMTDPASQTVDVKIRARKNISNAISANNVKAVVDLSVINHADLYTMPTSLSFPVDGVEIVEKRPYNVAVDVERLETAEKPVKISFTGVPKEGFAIGKYSSQPQTVEVKAPKSVMQNISWALATVDISDADADINELLPISLYDMESHKISDSRVELKTTTVEVNCTFSKQKEVEIVPMISNPPEGWAIDGVEVSPRTAVIEGPIDVLASISSVQTTPQISFTNPSPLNEATVSLKLPNGVASQQNNITVIVKLIRTQ